MSLPLTQQQAASADFLKMFPQFDCIAAALDRRQCIDKRTGELHSIIRLKKMHYCVVPPQWARQLEKAGYSIAVR
ncbi:hypothetical protein [Larkinella arboricola]|uniref:Uncharacterized protein n=1 Tax=Larkinella arboricola TaxID=643671 RepID=A0A327X5S0_LARAB|nr:hypothetical protein [Larkinella arboricola]RAK02367.1 hypothetical protein LX87_00487 [Larkinella arboricola]